MSNKNYLGLQKTKQTKKVFLKKKETSNMKLSMKQKWIYKYHHPENI